MHGYQELFVYRIPSYVCMSSALFSSGKLILCYYYYYIFFSLCCLCICGANKRCCETVSHPAPRVTCFNSYLFFCIHGGAVNLRSAKLDEDFCFFLKENPSIYTGIYQSLGARGGHVWEAGQANGRETRMEWPEKSATAVFRCWETALAKRGKRGAQVS